MRAYRGGLVTDGGISLMSSGWIGGVSGGGACLGGGRAGGGLHVFFPVLLVLLELNLGKKP